jgi:hypothetical protein
MIKSTLRFGVVLMAFAAFALTAQAQNLLWSEDFSGGFPAGWTNADASGQGVLFEWCNDPGTSDSPGCPSWFNDALNQQGPFASTTATNGFMSCDSDQAGPLATNHIVRMTTSAIDMSGESEVWIKFENHIGVYDVGAVTGALLRVSTDGVNWTPYTIFPGLTTTVRWSQNPQIVIADISATAANQATVYLQWEWTGNWEYHWSIDDIGLFDENPTGIFIPPHDMRVNSNWAAVAPNLLWPLAQAETFGFLADVENVGSQAQTNVVLNVTIEGPDNTVVYSEDLNYGTIGVDSLAENVPFAGAGYLPTSLGVYSGSYTISADSADVNPDNNAVTFQWLMTDTIFSKENGATIVTRPADANWTAGEPWSWAYGNYYYVKEASSNLFFSHVFFAIGGTANLAGENVILKIYEWVDNNGDGQADPNERTSVATMLYTITGTEAGNQVIAIPVTSLLGDPVPVKSNTEYLVVVEYQTDVSGSTITMGVSTAVDYGAMIFRSDLDGKPRYGSVLGILGNLADESYSSLGFGYDFVPVARVSMVEISSVKDFQLNGNLSVFPNPANTEVALNMEFNEMMKDVTIQLFDINGRLIDSRRMDNVTKQQVSFNTSQLVSGTYVFKVTTEKGVRSERFSVQR